MGTLIGAASLSKSVFHLFRKVFTLKETHVLLFSFRVNHFYKAIDVQDNKHKDTKRLSFLKRSKFSSCIPFTLSLIVFGLTTRQPLWVECC